MSALILLDGSDIPIMHLIQEVAADRRALGMRVEAVWVPDEEIGPHAREHQVLPPTGEPDADCDTYKDNV